MFDELLDNLSDRSRHRSGSSGGFLGRLTQILGGDEGEDRQDSRRSRDRNRRDDDRDHDERDRNHNRKRRDFDFDFGD